MKYNKFNHLVVDFISCGGRLCGRIQTVLQDDDGDLWDDLNLCAHFRRNYSENAQKPPVPKVVRISLDSDNEADDDDTYPTCNFEDDDDDAATIVTNNSSSLIMDKHQYMKMFQDEDHNASTAAENEDESLTDVLKQLELEMVHEEKRDDCRFRRRFGAGAGSNSSSNNNVMHNYNYTTDDDENHQHHHIMYNHGGNCVTQSARHDHHHLNNKKRDDNVGTGTVVTHHNDAATLSVETAASNCSSSCYYTKNFLLSASRFKGTNNGGQAGCHRLYQDDNNTIMDDGSSYSSAYNHFARPNTSDNTKGDTKSNPNGNNIIFNQNNNNIGKNDNDNISENDDNNEDKNEEVHILEHYNITISPVRQDTWLTTSTKTTELTKNPSPFHTY